MTTQILDAYLLVSEILQTTLIRLQLLFSPLNSGSSQLLPLLLVSLFPHRSLHHLSWSPPSAIKCLLTIHKVHICNFFSLSVYFFCVLFTTSNAHVIPLSDVKANGIASTITNIQILLSNTLSTILTACSNSFSPLCISHHRTLEIIAPSNLDAAGSLKFVLATLFNFLAMLPGFL